jgi:hypothetical protein
MYRITHTAAVPFERCIIKQDSIVHFNHANGLTGAEHKRRGCTAWPHQAKLSGKDNDCETAVVIAPPARRPVTELAALDPDLCPSLLWDRTTLQGQASINCSSSAASARCISDIGVK